VAARRLLITFWIWIAVLACAYFLIGHSVVVWAGIGLSSAAAVIVGVTLHKPRRRLPWLLLAVALVLLTAGDTTYLVLTQTLGQANPFPSLSDIFDLATYPFLIAALLLLPRSTRVRDRGGIFDALILTAGLGLLAWIFVIGPDLRDPSRSISNHVASIGYPLFDVLFLAAAARLLTEVRRTVSVLLLAGGGVALLVTDVLYTASQLQEQWRGMGGPVDAGWIVAYAMWGAAALHPSMYELTEPRVARDVGVTPARLVIVTVSALVAPVVLFIEPLRATTADAAPIAVLSTVLFLLVLMRLAGVLGNFRQATLRERSLREAGAALVSASDVETVRSVMLTAVQRLFPPGVAYEVALPLRDETMQDESIDLEVREQAVRNPLPTRFIRTDTIQAASLHGMRNHEFALVVPLVVTDRAIGEPLIGTLVLAAEDRWLAALQNTVEALAAQAALAIERITLNAEVARRDSEQYFRTLVQSTADVILIVDTDDTIRYASPSAALLFGPLPVTGRSIVSLVVAPQRELAGRTLQRVRAGENPPAQSYWAVERTDGGYADVEVSFSDLRSEPTVHGIVFTVRDVTERVRLERELTYLAYHDSLTGLPNRVRFGDEVQQAVLRSRPGGFVGVLFIDVDDFKVVNDTMGHDVGDSLLQEVARRLSTVVGHGDLAARLGGDEFAILIRDAPRPSHVEGVAQQVVTMLAEPVVLMNGSMLSASASIGVATTEDARGKGDLLRHADLALYVAKGSGKGRWRRFQADLHTQVVQRLETRAALDRAVAEGEFSLAYQPIVSLADAGPVGFEALLRWDDPVRGRMSPGEFIDVAEDSGLIVPIGEWTLHQAITDAAQWTVDNGSAPYVSINVSVRQFRSPGLLGRIERELRASRLPPTRLMLEITESLLLRDDEHTWRDLLRLRDLGIRVAIDDFGTGYSSLSYLRQVPADVLKLDKSFIDTMAASPTQRKVVETIIRLARTLGLDVIAEGIERSADRDLLAGMGCPYGQGFLFAGAMTDADARDWLTVQRARQEART
jgi:diguanylate cyclase (GGDEF)-like protein/PAS domain S-box-containing protein